MITKKKEKESFKSLKIFGAVGAILIGLTSCATNSSVKTTPLNIYQPSTLNLIKGNPIETSKGIYTPQVDEIWHSDARFRRLERQLYFPSGK